MCECCEKTGFYTENVIGSVKSQLFMKPKKMELCLDLDKKELYFTLGGEMMHEGGIPIKNCPMCGKKL